MSAWIPALMDATEGNQKLRKPSVVLAALALDEAGISVEDLMSGTTVLIATALALRDSIEGLVMTVLDGGRGFVGMHVFDSDAVVIVRHGKQQAGWRQEASDSGRAAVVIVGELADVHPSQVLATCDRKVYLDGEFWAGALEAAILAVTGEYVELDDHWPRVGYEDAVACIVKGSSAVECASRLYKLVSRRDDETGDDALDGLPRYGEEPAPLGQVASGVVRRLSEMTGFGAAGEWGIQAAADLRAYAAGELAWSEVDRGVLLSGPPGSGKTTFAKAFALECGPGVDLVTTTYTEWSAAGSGYGDSMSKGMAKLFEAWRAKAAKKPIILFIDEIDTIGRRGGNGNNESWFVAVINAWLAFLDGATPRVGIVVVAATNYPERVDPALLRPGRLDRQVELPYPGIEALAGIIRHHLGPDVVIDDADLGRAAKMCRGMSPAEVEQTCREARRSARLIHGRRVASVDVCAVLGARRLAALRKPGAAEHDRRVAVHEAAHAVALLSAPGERLSHVDLDASMTFGESRLSLSLAGAEARLVVLLAGLAAEQVLCGGHTSGVSGDLRDATSLATTAQVAWGMGERGLRVMAVEDAATDPAVCEAVDAILRAAHQRAVTLVEESRTAVLRLADALQADRYLDAAEVRAVVAGPAPAPVREERPTGRRGRHPGP